MENLTVVVPFWNGHDTIRRLVDSLPGDLPVIIVDDQSDRPLNLDKSGLRVIRPDHRGYFSGAVNTGVAACETDILILNQDAALSGEKWLETLVENRQRYATIGEGVMDHDAWPRGYVQGTFMFIRRDAWTRVGEFTARDWPLWGSTCEWQLRACRAGYEALPLAEVPGLHHGPDTRRALRVRGPDGERQVLFGQSIAEALLREQKKAPLFIRTPPLVSVVIPCWNYGRYLPDAVNSLLGGQTCLGNVEPQTFAGFEVIIVDDASDDGSTAICEAMVDRWKGVRCLKLGENVGTPAALNAGIHASYGRYIQILSADDMLAPTLLEVHLRVCEANPHSVAFGNLTVFKDSEKVRIFQLPAYDFEKVLAKNTVSAGIMFPKQAWKEVGGYPEIMKFGREDWAFNVALGAAGWCGVHSEDAGYLYRREKQNRSLRTGNVHKGEQAAWDGRDWRGFFREQMHSLYPKLYAGEIPMAARSCCGGRGGSRSNPGSNPGPPAPLAGAQGMKILEYIEGNDGTQTFTGPVTGTGYIFGGSKLVGYVDARDAPGLLNMRYGKKPIFRELKAKPTPPAPAAPDVAVANPEPTEKIRDPGEFSVRELKELDLTQEEAALMLTIEDSEAGQQRGTAITHLKRIANG